MNTMRRVKPATRIPILSLFIIEYSRAIVERESIHIAWLKSELDTEDLISNSTSYTDNLDKEENLGKIIHEFGVLFHKTGSPTTTHTKTNDKNHTQIRFNHSVCDLYHELFVNIATGFLRVLRFPPIQLTAMIYLQQPELFFYRKVFIDRTHWNMDVVSKQNWAAATSSVKKSNCQLLPLVLNNHLHNISICNTLLHSWNSIVLEYPLMTETFKSIPLPGKP